MHRTLTAVLIASGTIGALALPSSALLGGADSETRDLDVSVSGSVIGDRPASDGEPDDRPPTARPDRDVERLDMACEPIHRRDTGVAVACRWSEPVHAEVRGYMLWRAERDGDGREVVWHGIENHAVDPTVKPGGFYYYGVAAIDHDGRTRGFGGPVEVKVPPSDRPSPATMRLACEGITHDGQSGVVCKWSKAESRHAAGYRLWRSDGDDRRVVFATRDLDVTYYGDRAVRPGHSYTYLAETLDHNGHVIARSAPVDVTVPESNGPRTTGPVPDRTLDGNSVDGTVFDDKVFDDRVFDDRVTDATGDPG